jgi:MFS family permease
VESLGPLRQPAFRSLWLAGLASDAGDWLLFIALPIVVYQLTGSALGTSVAFVAELAPGILLAPLGGRLADRWDRRRLMVAVSALQGLALLPLLLVGGGHGLAIVYAVIVAQASLSALFNPAKNALLPTLVAPGELVAANSLVALGNGLGRLVGGPLGGVLLAAGSLRAIVAADALSFAVAALLITRLPAARPAARAATGARPSAGTATGGHPMPGRQRGRGLWSVLTDRRINGALIVTFVAQIAQGIFVVLFVVFVARRLHGGSAETGLLRGLQAVGAIAGGLVLVTGRLRTRRPALLTAVAALAFGVIDLGIWNGPLLSTSEALYVILFVVVGAPGVIMETGLISYLQSAGGDGERGRMFGAYGVVENAGQAVGIVAAGMLTAPLGLMTLLNAQGALCLAAGALAVMLMMRPALADRERGPVEQNVSTPSGVLQ